jgi:flavin-dependent dehydrogenase
MAVSADLFDVLVVGAGPAGSTAARLLARGGASVLLVDPLRLRHCRLELVAPRALSTFEDLDLGHIFLDGRFSHPCLGIRKNWGRSGIHIDEFLRYPGGRGYVLDRARFDAELLKMARDEGVCFTLGTVTAVRVEGGSVRADISFEGTTTGVRATLVVDATGRPASIARRLGTTRTVHEHLLASLNDLPEDKACEPNQWLNVRGLSQGWRYNLLGPHGVRQSWSVQRGKASFNRPSTRHNCYDASSACLDTCAGPHWLAIGDAAAAYDPISSQGLASALASALAASELALSGGPLAPSEQQKFSALVARTHARTEAGRRALYEAAA